MAPCIINAEDRLPASNRYPGHPVTLIDRLQQPALLKTVQEGSMCCGTDDQKNMFLDRILAERHSYRMFKPEVPHEEAIRRIIHAGLLAPFAAAAVGNSMYYFRRFFVMEMGSQSIKSDSSSRYRSGRGFGRGPKKKR